MDYLTAIKEALLTYVFFIPLLTFHEWAHAWVAWKCGDDTAYQRGRVSLNPIVHMELIGTVVLPLVGLISGAMGAGIAIIGWGKPVPVNPANLKHPRLQDTLIAMAGPAMNVLLALVLLGLAKVGLVSKQFWLLEISARMAQISLFLCFFNLLPIPPLDGSHLLLNLTRMSYETYYRLAQAGFILIIILIQLQPVRVFLSTTVGVTFHFMAKLVGL